MKHGLIKHFSIASALALGLGIGTAAHADENWLPAVDSLLTTVINKSVISGAVPQGSDGMIQFDANGYVKFDYSGDVYSIETVKKTGELSGLDKAIGTITGQAAFHPDFAMLAIGLKAYMYGVGPMPAIPAVVPWTCNSCTMTVDGTIYRSIVDVPGFPAGMVEAMRMQGRAFTGLGPVEVGQLSAESLSIRMAGCSAVIGTDGPNAGKMGTLCVNSTLTFDLAGIDLGNPMASLITAKGTSNCTMVLHQPLAM